MCDNGPPRFNFCSWYRFRIDSQYVIKVSDFGLSEDVYLKNYFRQDTAVKLPVKWMAPESLTDGLFAEKTDVVCVYCTISVIAQLGHCTIILLHSICIQPLRMT